MFHRVRWRQRAVGIIRKPVSSRQIRLGAVRASFLNPAQSRWIHSRTRRSSRSFARDWGRRGLKPEIRSGIDTLLVAGGIGARRTPSDRALVKWLRRIAPRVRRLASVCTGAFLLI